MKARFYLAMATAALLMSNCSQEEALNQVQGGTNTLTATIEGASRSAVTDAGVFSWTAGDAFSVYNGEDFTTFTLSSGNVFTSNETITPSGVAIYPAGSHTYDGTTTKVNLATEYSYGSTNAPMVAQVTGSTLEFKHVGGLMRFIVKGMPSTATSFTFTANSGITGGFDVNNGVITAATASDENKSVAIKFTAGQVNTESMTFYIPLPTGTYSGYTVSVGDGQGMSNTSDATVKNTIARGTLLLMPTFTYDATNGLSKGADGGVVTLEGGEQSLAVSGTQAVKVDASELTGAEAVLNLNYTPEENSTLTLSESSDETESQDESAATVSVSVPTGTTVTTLDITMPSMTVELNAAENETATYTTVNALTAQNTLKIGEGVSVGTLNIKGGHVRLAGSITTSITRDDNNVDEVTYIILEDGVTAPTVTLPENVKVVNAAEYDLIRAVENAEAGSTVTLESNVDLSGSIVITKNLTVNLNDKEIKCASSDVFVVTNGTLTINGKGTVWGSNDNSSSSCAVWAKESGKVVINGGTYKVGHDGASKESNSANWRNDCIYARDNASIEINGGEFMYTGEIDESNAQSNGHTFLLNIKDGSSASIVVKGGTFHKFNPGASNGENPVANFVAAGYSSVAGDNETYTVSEGIWDEAALRATIAAGFGFTLCANIDLASSVEISSGNVEMNLNGKYIKCASSDVFVVTGGTLAISGEGTVWGSEDNSSSSCAVWAKDNGRVIIYGGTYKVGHDGASKESNSANWRNDCIYARDNAYIEINGGEFMYTGEIDESNAQSNGHTFLLNIKDGSSASIVVRGGTFHKFNPGASNGENPVANFVAEGYSSSTTNDGDTYVVTKD